MTVASLCNDILVLAVFLLVGFFVRELCKPHSRSCSFRRR